MSQYMIEFALPEQLDEAFMRQIPAQQMQVARLFSQGKLLTYTLTRDRLKLWASVVADSELEAIEIAESLPLTPRMSYDLHPLFFNEIVTQRGLPAISLN